VREEGEEYRVPARTRDLTSQLMIVLRAQRGLQSHTLHPSGQADGRGACGAAGAGQEPRWSRTVPGGEVEQYGGTRTQSHEEHDLRAQIRCRDEGGASPVECTATGKPGSRRGECRQRLWEKKATCSSLELLPSQCQKINPKELGPKNRVGRN